MHKVRISGGEEMNQLEKNQQAIITELQQQIEDMKVCRDHWKASYEARHKVIKDILDFYDRWKGVSQNWNQTLRTKRDREAYKLIKEIVAKANGSLTV
jgi:hypothetical protein